MSIHTTGFCPESCRKNLERLVSNVKTDEHTAYAMILMTATLMDLRPSDPKVVEIILDDCKGLQAVSKDE